MNVSFYSSDEEEDLARKDSGSASDEYEYEYETDDGEEESHGAGSDTGTTSPRGGDTPGSTTSTERTETPVSNVTSPAGGASSTPRELLKLAIGVGAKHYRDPCMELVNRLAQEQNRDMAALNIAALLHALLCSMGQSSCSGSHVFRVPDQNGKSGGGFPATAPRVARMFPQTSSYPGGDASVPGDPRGEVQRREKLLGSLRAELAEARRRSEQAEREAGEARRASEEDRHEAAEARRASEQAQHEAAEARRASEEDRYELAALQRELDSVRAAEGPSLSAELKDARAREEHLREALQEARLACDRGQADLEEAHLQAARGVQQARQAERAGQVARAEAAVATGQQQQSVTAALEAELASMHDMMARTAKEQEAAARGQEEARERQEALKVALDTVTRKLSAAEERNRAQALKSALEVKDERGRVDLQEDLADKDALLEVIEEDLKAAIFRAEESEEALERLQQEFRDHKQHCVAYRASGRPRTQPLTSPESSSFARHQDPRGPHLPSLPAGGSRTVADSRHLPTGRRISIPPPEGSAPLRSPMRSPPVLSGIEGRGDLALPSVERESAALQHGAGDVLPPVADEQEEEARPAVRHSPRSSRSRPPASHTRVPPSARADDTNEVEKAQEADGAPLPPLAKRRDASPGPDAPSRRSPKRRPSPSSSPTSSARKRKGSSEASPGPDTSGLPPRSPAESDLDQPFPRPTSVVTAILSGGDKKTWDDHYADLGKLRRLVRNHADIVRPALSDLVRVMIAGVKNLRSQVTRLALECIADFFAHLGRSMEAHLNILITTLVHKSGDSSSFISEAVRAGLSAMAEHTSFAKCMPHLEGMAGDRNASCRAAVAETLARCVKVAGARLANSPGLEQTLSTLLLLAQDSHEDARRHARGALCILDSNIEDLSALIGRSQLSEQKQRDIMSILAKSSPVAASGYSAKSSSPAGTPKRASKTSKSSRGTSRRQKELQEELEGMFTGLGSNEWKTRMEKLEELGEVMARPGVEVDALALFGALTPRLNDANKHVRVRALETCGAILPHAVACSSLSLVAEGLVAALCLGVVASNRSVKAKAMECLHVLCAEAEAADLVAPLAYHAVNGNTAARSILVSELAGVLEEDPGGPIPTKKLVPLIRSVAAHKPAAHPASLRLLRAAHARMGADLFSHVPPDDRASLRDLLLGG